MLLRAEQVEKKFRKGNTAFITFKSMYPVRAPPQAFIDPHVMQIEPAPSMFSCRVAALNLSLKSSSFLSDPSDVNWGQLLISYHSRWFRFLITNFALACLLILWVFPVAGIQTLANLEEIARVLSWLQRKLTLCFRSKPRLLDKCLPLLNYSAC